ncbi:hypothetical protein, partial [Kribbella sp.]|uniref:hypothetical protein n=1 Tax=Kribbella sp. TaxID=1871183 RepID=UPI002D6BD05A
MSRDQAAEVVGAVAERLLSPEMVAEIAGRGTDRTADGVVGPAWQPAGLAEGHPGIALLHAELGNPVVAHAHLAAANHAADPTGGGPELYAGRLPGLLLAAVGARRAEGGGYTTLTD